ncbi:hypothetical protein TREMEDRAFT_58878 [Tremella mesenterica DSM 1558]|uniref:uncharacterized protein n=1 Tax=Tremella mesenterica (strain ATCC 24925 / CBS 8224 / DSM 1558 / NBRC 9311 / NRRL Y-6157 / RJB 2259-6 / UBC 559-6) TaxID=578456 RepID=UPI0003F4A3AE|nr:uncharacterized protein TREMEDRAFT_58878 [Tremella mesenterica DSM 1558]EIW72709.1 hypothetical protein TREMEDRAFT_58878 [Tremella mesenterica DSM 1558]
MTTSSPTLTPLYLITTSQTPLPLRFPRPQKPNLVVPPLIHRSLHSALDADPPSIVKSKGTLWIPDPLTVSKHDLPSIQSNLPLPTPPSSAIIENSQPPNLIINHTHARGNENDELTVKLHLVGSASPSIKAKWVEEALRILGEIKGLYGANHLLLGFKGVDYKGKKTDKNCQDDVSNQGSEDEKTEKTLELENEVEIIWKLVNKGCNCGIVDCDCPSGEPSRENPKEIGTLYLPLGLLKKLTEGKYPVRVNAMDTPDCHHLPKGYTEFARSKGVELWAGGGGEGSDPLPNAHLHNLLQEFSGILAEHIGASHLLEKQIAATEDGLGWDESGDLGVDVRWVLGYSLVSDSRNVVTDKGYIVAASIR